MKRTLRLWIAVQLVIGPLLPSFPTPAQAQGPSHGQAARMSKTLQLLQQTAWRTIEISPLPFTFPSPSPGLLETPPVGPAGPQGTVEYELGLTPQDLALLKQIADLIKRSSIHADNLTSKQLLYGALKGMVREINKQDRYADFYTPEEYAKLQNTLRGQVSGIGAAIVGEKEKGKPVEILYPLPNSPAKKAELQAGDQILKVDGVSTLPLDVSEAISRILGPQGTQVTLTIGRTDPQTRQTRTWEVRITRALVQMENVFSEVLPDHIGYIYLVHFSEGAELDVLRHIRTLRAQGARALILDIRNNPGGQLDTVSILTKVFLRANQNVVTTENRRKESYPDIAKRDGEFKDLPLKVLVNGYSASASEILAGALQDHRRARIIGSKTYGKGTVQVIQPFPDGSAIKLTVQTWKTPNGHLIQKDPTTGAGAITPDVEVEVSKEIEGKIMDQILQKLNRSPIPGTPVSDPVLERALQDPF